MAQAFLGKYVVISCSIKMVRYCLMLKIVKTIKKRFPLKKLLTVLHSEKPKLYTILAFLSALGLIRNFLSYIYLKMFKLDSNFGFEHLLVTKYTVKSLRSGTNRFEHIVTTQIILLLKELSDLGLHSVSLLLPVGPL